MSDEGLAVGAGLALWAENVRANGEIPSTNVIKDVYLSREATDGEIEAEIRKVGMEYHRSDDVREK